MSNWKYPQNLAQFSILKCKWPWHDQRLLLCHRFFLKWRLSNIVEVHWHQSLLFFCRSIFFLHTHQQSIEWLSNNKKKVLFDYCRRDHHIDTSCKMISSLLSSLSAVSSLKHHQLRKVPRKGIIIESSRAVDGIEIEREKSRCSFCGEISLSSQHECE